MKKFEPLHITATAEDMLGNKGNGRYLFTPGSTGRAKAIAIDNFDCEPIIRKSSRGHDLYIGTITRNGVTIDVGAISTGMGCPSVDIIITELIKLGGKRFLRLGTSGMLQPEFMKAGDFCIATGAVRDEGTSCNYVPYEFPAVTDFNIVNAAKKASEVLKLNTKTHIGLVHSKDSLYAREFKSGPQKEENTRYMQLLKDSGVIASEMEASQLLILTSLYDGELRKKCLNERILGGIICCILGEEDDFGTQEMVKKMTNQMIELGIQTYFELNKLGY